MWINAKQEGARAALAQVQRINELDLAPSQKNKLVTSMQEAFSR